MPEEQQKKTKKPAAKPKKVEVKELPTSPEELTEQQAEAAKAGQKRLIKRPGGPAGSIWWNPIPIQPMDGQKRRTRRRAVGAYRKGGRGPQGESATQA